MKYTEVVLPHKIKNSILAVGAQSKSSFCFARGNYAYLSDTGGDLSDLENFKKFEKQIKGLQKKLKIKPDLIACDLHPEYVSTKYALRVTSYELRVTQIQHHEAHVASCMADNNIKDKVIGVAFDGTGFGSDGNIWGGEFFVGGIKGLQRAAHLKYIPMPGGEACIREPWRMAFSYLYSMHMCRDSTLWCPYNYQDKILKQMIDKKINSPLTSSMGRLFDAVSSLIGVCGIAKDEGEAAIKLEKMILVQGSTPFHKGTGHGFKVQGKYEFNYIDENRAIIIDWEPVIKGIVKDLKLGVKKPEISIKFHNGICDMIKDVCKLIREKYKIDKVCMSGGVFQNQYLSSQIKPILEKEGFCVYVHKNIPTHDGGIALGQVVLTTTPTA